MRLAGLRARLPDRAALLLAAAAGALLAAAFAPYGVWPLAVLCPAVLLWLWQDATPRAAARLGFAFNAGTFVVGTWWLYVSLHGFGQAPVWMALGLMAGLVAIMAAYHAALGYAVARWLPQRGPLRWMVGAPAAWLLVEWWRGWFLSGFSWLSLGYSQTDTVLAGYAPVGGVYLLGALLLVCGGALVTLALGTPRERGAAAAVVTLIWAGGAWLAPLEWSHPSGPPVSVAIAQGAIPQDQKWQDDNVEATLERYRRLATEGFGARLIVMPESALPGMVHEYVDYITELYRLGQRRGSALVLGVLREDPDERYYNSILALDGAVHWYDKHHLVPFSEFFPVPPFVRSWLRLMTLPYSDFTRGAAVQPPLPAGGLKLGATVCYEDAYGSGMLPVLHEADALVNVTNDAWFGHSSARHQHFQIARMRALEERRYMIRAANDGISGVIGPHGEVVARAPEFQPAVLRASVVPRTGLPPYAHVGNALAVGLAALGLALALAPAMAGTAKRRRAAAAPLS